MRKYKIKTNRSLAITNPMNLLLPVTPVPSSINCYVTVALYIKKEIPFHLVVNESFEYHYNSKLGDFYIHVKL